MFKIRIETNLDSIDMIIKSIEPTPAEMMGLWFRLANTIRDYNKALFSNQGFGRWPFYTETFAAPKGAQHYINWKNKHYPGTGPELLVLTGDLRKSLTQPGGDNTVIMTPTSFTFGTDVKWAKFQKNRPFLDWNSSFKKVITVETKRFFKEKRKK